MSVWNLEPGAERPQPVSRSRAKGPTATGNITPMEIAQRAQALGARIVFKDTRYRIYPPDQGKSPIFMPDRFNDSRTRLNTIAELRRASLDIFAEPEQETIRMPLPNSAQPAPKPGPSASARALTGLEQQIKGLFEMVAEGDAARISDIDQLRRRVEELEQRLAVTPGAPPARDPAADLDEAILAFMRATPIKLSASVIAGNLTVPGEVTDEQVTARLDVLAAAGMVIASGDASAGARLYRPAPAAGQAA